MLQEVVSVWVIGLVALVALSRWVRLRQWLVVLVPSPTMMMMMFVVVVPRVLVTLGPTLATRLLGWRRARLPKGHQ